MSKTQNRDFAVGRDTHDDCSCPAVHAGFQPSAGDKSLVVAEAWDEIMRARMGVDRGPFKVTEQIARDAWIEAIEAVQNDHLARDKERTVGEEIAEELGWL
jgi:hypothetical protein